MATNWNLLQMPDIGQAFQQGRETRRQEDARNALAAYATNPNEQSLNALAPVAPQFVIQQRQVLEKQRKEQEAVALRQRAAQGDVGAVAQLAGVDWEAWKSLDENNKKKTADRVKYIGQVGLRISQLPEAQRSAAWDQAAQQGAQLGFPELAAQVGQYSPQALQGAIDNAGLVEKFISLAEPKYLSIPAGGTLVNTRDPSAIAEFNSNPPPAINEGATATNPQTGEKIQFKGGQWVPMGGGGSNTTGGFRP